MIHRFVSLCRPLRMELYEWIARSDFDRAKSAVSFIEDCIRQYGLQHIALSFNGGKDCTALLHLTRAALAHLNLPLSALLVLYFDEPDPFPEMAAFLQHTVQLHRLTSLTLTGSYRSALTNFFSHPSSPSQPRITAILLGQRRADPHSHSLSLVTPSSEGWPAFLRINPLLDWAYSDVWRLLREGQRVDASVQWCPLYEMGYTSVGARSKTNVTRALWDDEKAQWKGAWELVEEADERGGRDVEETKSAAHSTNSESHQRAVELDKEVASTAVPVFHDGDTLHRMQSVPLVDDSTVVNTLKPSTTPANG